MLPAIKANIPDAFIGGGVCYFNPNNQRDMAEHAAFMQSLVAAPMGCGVAS